MAVAALLLAASAAGWSASVHSRKGPAPLLSARRRPLAALPRQPGQCLESRRHARLAPLCARAETDTKVAMDAERRDEFAAAISQTGLLFGAALAFCSGVFLVRGPEDATAWFAAYILEESLSVDNLFVFSLIFDYFQTPANAQPRVLRWGLIVAAAQAGGNEPRPSPAAPPRASRVVVPMLRSHRRPLTVRAF